jgi:hypothetical protein
MSRFAAAGISASFPSRQEPIRPEILRAHTLRWVDMDRAGPARRF